MSTYEQSFSQAAGERVDAPTVDPSFSGAFPELARLFSGRLNSENGRCEIPPATITLFFEGGRFKFCVHPRTGGKVAFGTVSEPLEGLVGIEKALAAGHFEWKAKGGQKRS